MKERTRSSWRWALLLMWYLAIVLLIFLLHDFPGREFRYWRM